MRIQLPLAVLALAAMIAGPASAYAGTTLTPNTTLSAETGNNTSASSSFTGTVNGNIAPANVSKVSIKSLIYPGSTSKMYVHLQAWWGGTNHINIGYNSADPAQVQRQVTDMMSRGVDGTIIDWYGPNATRENTATQYMKIQAEAENGAFQFGVDYDGGALKACYKTTGCDVTQQAINDLNYAYSNFEQSPAYIKVNGRPMVMTFGTEAYPLDWTRIAAGVAGNPVFVFRNSGGFSKADSSGGYSWVAPETVTSTDPLALTYLDKFLATSLTYSAMVGTGSGYKGFDDSIASWTHHYYIPQNCGQTWMTTLSQATKYYSTASQLWGFQLATWNDYEEGTEVETGIDNCATVTAAVSGSTLSWDIGTTPQNVIDHFTLFISADGTNLMSLGDVPAIQRSLDLAPFGFNAGSYQVFVKAVGRPMMTNHTSAAAQYTVAAPASPPTVSVSATPSKGIAPTLVNATATATSSASTVNSVDIDFGDGTIASASSATHTYSAAGTYTIKATATDANGAKGSSTTSVTIAANQPPQTVLTVSPATANIGTSITASTASSTDSDGTIASSSIDFGDGTVLSGATVAHAYTKAGTYTVKGTTTDNLGASSSQTATVTVTTPATISIASPLNGASIVGPVSFSASATSPNTITAMQIYVDGVLAYKQASSPLSTSLNLAVGAHKLTVKAWDNLSNSWMQTIGITVNANQQPVVALSVTPTTGTASLLVSASTAGSYDPDGTIASTSINFGDGSSISGASGSHTYTKAGTYTVTATVTDNMGASSTKSQVVTVNAPVVTSAPPVLTIAAPTSGSYVLNYMKVAATASSQRGIAAMQVYVDGVKVYQVNTASISTALPLTRGTHSVVVQAWDTAGAYTKSAMLSVTSQ